MQNIIEAFKNLFQLLSNTTRKIFKYLRWMCETFRAVFPSRDTIASVVGCSTKTVDRALKKLTDLGWIVIKNRGYQSNVYFMAEDLIKLDPNDPKTFKKEIENHCIKHENVPTNVPVLDIVYIDDRSASNEAERQDLKEAILNRDLPIPDVEVDEICDRFGVPMVKTVLKRIVKNNWLYKKFIKTDNPCAYLTTCLTNEAHR